VVFTIAATMREDGSADVRIDGALTRGLGAVATQAAPYRLRLVRALSETDQIHQAASS